jgi:hypothetical protein
MRQRLASIILILLATHLLGVTGAAQAPPVPTLLVPFGTRIRSVSTDGTHIVWSGGGALSAVTLQDRQLRILVHLTASTGAMSIDEGVVVWSDRPRTEAGSKADQDAFGLEIATGRRFVIADSPADEVVIDVSAGFASWLVADPTSTALWGRDLRTMAAPTLLLSSEMVRPWRLGWSTLVSNRRLVWEEIEPIDDGYRWRLRTRPIEAAAAITLAEGRRTGSTVLLFRGDWLVYPDERALTAVNLATSQTKPVPGVPAGGASLDGRYLWWPQPRQIGDRAVHELWGYDLVTDSRFLALPDPPLSYMGAASNGVVTWIWDDRSAQYLHGIARAALLPTAPRPGASDGDWTFFAETGHALASGFKTFWERGGGLPVFGFPLTEEFEQRNADTGRLHTVQFFERQRFEYHPELAGTPYEVSLGRLGAEDALRRELTGTWVFQPVPATADHPAGCRYLPATRHRLCGAFRLYWEGHGLELGDDGISFREALALFGYPLSEEFVDPESGLITQYFERAVFEYHPGSPPGQRVLLRRLGAEWLAQVGW